MASFLVYVPFLDRTFQRVADDHQAAAQSVAYEIKDDSEYTLTTYTDDRRIYPNKAAFVARKKGEEYKVEPIASAKTTK